MRFAPGLACTFNGSLDISGAGLVDGYLGLLFRCWMVGCLVLFWLAIWLAGQFAKWSKSKHQQQDTIASIISVIIMICQYLFLCRIIMIIMLCQRLRTGGGGVGQRQIQLNIIM